MGKETERKFLVRNNDFKSQGKPVFIRQGYLNSDRERVVRVRIMGRAAFLTVKGISRGLTRKEFEYAIPVADAGELLGLCEKPLIEKDRYLVEYKGFTWAVDVFHGENEGLVLAEIELESAGQSFELPAWAGAEVSGDPKYFNARLIKKPFKNW
ncbi:MAG: CYTH domain-containing protein [Bacteroidales bacterium]